MIYQFVKWYDMISVEYHIILLHSGHVGARPPPVISLPSTEASYNATDTLRLLLLLINDEKSMTAQGLQKNATPKLPEGQEGHAFQRQSTSLIYFNVGVMGG